MRFRTTGTSRPGRPWNNAKQLFFEPIFAKKTSFSRENAVETAFK